MNTLQQQLINRMQEKNLSAAELERKAGLKMSAVRNIIKGQSKKPSAESLIAISQVLECTIEDLFEVERAGSSGHVPMQKKEDPSEPVEDLKFLAKTADKVIKLLSEADKNCSFEEVFFFIQETYMYSLGSSYPEVDVAFAKWLISKN
ncbi:MAG: helix-turn-helix transcriptional regulator [Pseudomonadota bacterium]